MRISLEPSRIPNWLRNIFDHSPSWPPFRLEKLQETSILALDSILARIYGEAIDIWSRCREFRK
jgi:hypothetical protein